MKPMIWENPKEITIDNHAMYLVKTDGAKWGDSDIVMRPGFAILKILDPNIIRGKYLFVAKITDPLEP